MTVQDLSTTVGTRDHDGRFVAQHPGRTNLRDVVAGLFISVDGVVESPQRWQFDNFDAEMMFTTGAQLGAQDAVLSGRVTYRQ